jgi:predicted TIM-barrel fold metal-dependent hydrolase
VAEPAVIDIHQHAGPLGTTPREWLRDSAWRSDRDSRLRTMDRLGIDAAILGPLNSYLRPGGTEDTRALNEGLSSYAASAPDRFIGVAGAAEPQHGESGLEELRHMREELGFVAFTLHPRFQGVAADSVWVRHMVTEAAKLRLLPLIHSYCDSRLEDPALLAAVASQSPAAALVVLDGFSSHHHALACFDLAARCPNVIFDTNMIFRWRVLDEAVSRLGPGRVVFGTNLYPEPSVTEPFISPAALRHRGDDQVAALVLGANTRALVDGC